MTKKSKLKSQVSEEVTNSLSGLASSLLGENFPNAQITKRDTLLLNVNPDLITFDRTLLENSYAKIGIVQNFIDVPVDDALKGGIIINSELLGERGEDDHIELDAYIKENNIVDIFGQGFKWARLFGGGGLIIMTDQNTGGKFNINSLNKNSRLSFRVVDRWQLFQENNYNFFNRANDYQDIEAQSDFFNYNGIRIDRSRVILFLGKEAPYLVKRQLSGWGMSELEAVMPAMNLYLKTQNVIFELMDEAKVDVYKIKDYATKLLDSGGTAKIDKLVRHTNMIKSHLNSLIMDSDNDYEQKTVNFSGLSEISEQNRINLSSNLREPMTKTFGVASTGFNSGEDDIENYNSKLESEIRSKIKPQMIKVIKIICQKLFEFVPEDLTIDFPALRIMSTEQEENVKDKRYQRLLLADENGQLQDGEFADAVNKNDLLPIKIKGTKGIREPKKTTEDKKDAT